MGAGGAVNGPVDDPMMPSSSSLLGKPLRES